MKRIIDGVTYNTETSTLVAERTVTDEGSGTVTEVRLYQNRAGVYFEVETVTTTYRDRNEEMQERVSYNWVDVGDAQKAREWCEKYELTIVGEINDLPPEAEPGEKLATLYIRLPPSLKFSIEDRAKRQGVSANVFALRCLEGCVAPAIHGKASDVPGPHAPALSGELVFDYSSYNGRYAIGEEHLRFDTLWSKASSDCIYILNDPPSISGVAIAVGAKSISDVKDASVYDFTSRTRTPRKGEIVILKNVRGYFAAIEILGVKDNTRPGADKDELHLRYVINPDGSGAFNSEG